MTTDFSSMNQILLVEPSEISTPLDQRGKIKDLPARRSTFAQFRIVLEEYNERLKNKIDRKKLFCMRIVLILVVSAIVLTRMA